MLLSEILTPLFEELGNLSLIDKKFRKVFNTVDRVRVPHDSEYGYADKDVHMPLPGIGDKSKIETVAFKTNTASINELAKPEVLGLIVVAGKEQLAMIMKQPKGTNVAVGLDMTAISSLIEDETESEKLLNDISMIFGQTQRGISRRGKSTPTKRVGAKIDDLDINREATQVQFKALTALLSKTLKALGIAGQLLVIYKDEERLKMQTPRKNSRYGSYNYDANSLARFNKDAKGALRSRLDVFKSSKAVGVDKLEDLINAIKTKGYLDKIKIAGYTYDLKRSDIRMDYLKQPTAYNYAYVDYEMNQSTTEYEEYSNKRHAIRADTKNDDVAREEKLNALMQTVPPKTIKILLKLDKGSIVPDKIQQKQRNNWE